MSSVSRLLMLVLLAAFGANAVAAEPSLAEQEVTADAASGAALENPQSVVVGQGEAEITLLEVDAYGRHFPEEERGHLFDDPHRIEDVLHTLLTREQIALEAREMGLDKDPIVQAQIRQAADTVLAQLRLQALRTDIESKLPDLTQLASERYRANPSDYAVASSVDVKHILVGIDERTEDEAKALADKLHAELKADPSKFGAYVDKYSDDKSKTRNHGLIPDATSEGLVKPFRDAAATLRQVGDMSAPIETKFGYHILKLVKVTPAHQQSFEEVRDDLVAKLQREYVAKKMQAYKDGVRSTPLRDINPDLLQALRTRYYPNHERPTIPSSASSSQ